MTPWPVVFAALLGLALGAVLATLWRRRDHRARSAWREARRQRRGDLVREAVALARDNLMVLNADRALKWARRALRLDRCSVEAHAIMGACRSHVEHYGQALVHHRRAEDLAMDLGRREKGAWRFQNALDAVQACMLLRSEASDEEAQALWDEAHAWAGLAHRLNPDAAKDEFAFSPWLAGLTSKGGEPWLIP